MTFELVCDKNKTNLTEKGAIPFTWYFIVKKIPHCAKCNNDIQNDENAYFCFLSKKLFCWKCSAEDLFVCHEFFPVYEDHSDRLVKIRIDNDG